jgi:uncharacterized protein involved in outer membrane biogenesis
MGPSTRKKIIIGVGGIVGLLIVALLVAPSFFDLDKYKPQLISEVKKATGRDLAVDGPVSLSLLPLPSVSVTGVKFQNLPGSKNPNMVEIKSVTVKPSLFALLGGNLEVNSVTLVEPRIVLEVNAEGKPNWEFTPSVAAAKPAAATPSSPQPLSLGQLDIENGIILFSDSKQGVSVAAEQANFSASVGSLDGPYRLTGSARVNGAPLDIDLSVSAKGSSGHAADLALSAGGGKLTFKGTLSELGPNARVGGAASVQAESLTRFIDTLTGLAGQPAPILPPLLAGKFSFDGSIDVSQTSFAARDFKMNLADDSGSGSLSVTLKPALAINGKLVLPKIDLDRTLAALDQQAAPGAASSSPGKPGTATPARPSSNDSYLSNITAKLSIEAGEVIYNKTAIRNVALDIDAHGGAVAVPRLSATFPGDAVLQAKSTLSGDPTKPTVSGDFSLVGPKLRDTLAWLKVDTSSIPANKLARLSLKGRMASAGGNVQVTDAAFELDDVKGTGGVIVTFSVPLSVVAHVDLDTLDLDPFLAGDKGGATAKPAASAAPAAPAGQGAPGPSFGLKTRINKLIYNKETIGGVEVDVALQGSTLKINDVKVSNLAGARLAVRGSVANYGSTDPHPDIAFNFEAPDMGRVMKMAGGSAPAGLGQVNASGGISGSAETVTLKDLSVSAMGNSLKASGVLSAPGAANGTPQSVDYKGSVTLNGQTIEGTVDAKLAGKPTINADLRANALDVDKLAGSASAASTSSQRGRPAAAPAPPSAPIDTGPMRSVDASVKLVAAALVMAPAHITNADLVLTLKDGVLTVSHFKGALFGGAMQLAGTIDGSTPTLAIDLKGDAENIYIGEMLRETSGGNQFGSAVKVTIDGKLNARGLSIKGAGSTSNQIKSSMVGGADLSGHIFVGADKALTMIGSAATGAAGGVIDNTLGNVLGIVGQRGGVGVGNLLNAISLVLNRFVNNDSPISGRVDIAGGVLTDKALTVQGKGSTANISTRTNLAASTTDTTINFYIDEDRSAPYLISTIRGPTSNLSYNVARGTAKDPPGFVNTLTNTVTQPVQQVPKLLPNLPIPIPNPFGR